MKQSKIFDFPESLFEKFIYIPGYASNSTLVWNIIKSSAELMVKEAGTKDPDKWLKEFRIVIENLFIDASARSRSSLIGISFCRTGNLFDVIIRTDSKALVIEPCEDGYSADNTAAEILSAPYSIEMISREVVISQDSQSELLCRIRSEYAVEFITRENTQIGNHANTTDNSPLALISRYSHQFIYYAMPDGCGISYVKKCLKTAV